MYQRKTYEIKSCDDEELGIKRDSLLEFKVSFDDEKEMKALFFFINGIRDSEYASYEEHLAEFVVKEFGVAVICVEYHCIGLRPQTGATAYMDKRDKENFLKTCKEFENLAQTSIEFDENLFDNTILNQQECEALIESTNNVIEMLKNENKIPKDKTFAVPISFCPTKNEYQNFGLMQALDILNALCFIKNNPPFKLAKDYKSLLFGTSHGGYIAFLAAKFAPWLVDAVVENSGYVNAPLRMIGFGKELDYIHAVEASIILTSNLALCISTKTHFTLDKNSPNCYTDAFDKIRSLIESEHLELQASYHKPVYVSYHSINDDLALPDNKIKFYEKLVDLGFEARLHMIKDESELDGKFIKNLKHGMDMSLKTLIQKELPPLLARTFKRDKKEKRHITYVSEDLEYHFEERGGGIKLTIFRNDKGKK